MTRWISTDNSVATFTTPGYASAVGSGFATIYAENEIHYSLESFSYRFRVGERPEQVNSVDVRVQLGTSSNVPAGAVVEFISQVGPRQVCMTRTGPPGTPCRFWSEFGTAVVRASKDGYVTAETTIVASPRLNLSSPLDGSLRLSPVSPN